MRMHNPVHQTTLLNLLTQHRALSKRINERCKRPRFNAIAEFFGGGAKAYERQLDALGVNDLINCLHYGVDLRFASPERAWEIADTVYHASYAQLVEKARAVLHRIASDVQYLESGRKLPGDDEDVDAAEMRVRFGRHYDTFATYGLVSGGHSQFYKKVTY